MKFTKLFILILVLAMAISFVTSCTDAPSGGNEPEDKPVTSQSQQEPSENNTEETEKPDETETPETSSPSGAATVESHVIFEDSGIKITVKELDMDAFFGPELKFLIENDTEEDVEVTVNSVSVNGYAISSYLFTDVSAGKKANDYISLSESDLEERGISVIADIELDFIVYKNDSWDLICQSDMIRIETSAAVGFVYTYDESGVEAYNDNGVLIVTKGIDEDEFLGESVVVYIYNKNDAAVTVSARNVSVNGFMLDPIFSVSVPAGKHALQKLYFFDSDLEENEIEHLDDVEITFYIYYTDTWDDIAYSDPVHVTRN